MDQLRTLAWPGLCLSQSFGCESKENLNHRPWLVCWQPLTLLT